MVELARLQAKRWLDRFGEDVSILVVTSGGVLDPLTQLITAEVETPYTAKGVFTSYDAQLVDGATIRTGDLKCEIAAQGLGVIPQPGDTLLRGVARLEIVGLATRVLQGETVSYQLHVRGNG